MYEVLWSRYLGLYVGHSAYAQVLVLSVYLGGMAVGGLAVADLSKRLNDPIRWYAGAEAVLGVFGLLFHVLFVAVTEYSYDVLFPGVGSAAAVGALRWGLAGLLILPQAVVLGTTFPLMAAALVRADASRPGGGVALAYLLNTLGGAVGVLLAGFGFIAWFGLPGTSVAAAVLNFSAAGLVLGFAAHGGSADATPIDSEPDATEHSAPELTSAAPGLVPILLVVAFGTALASFVYEIGWIRMLSLVLGSATHSFELMLSAFILGIAIGAWLIRRRADTSATPVRLLGWIQVGMGLAALASLPLYLGTFDVMGALVRSLSGDRGGYLLLNMGRYGLALVVMLPATVLAGMTLPMITGALLRSGRGEHTIGRVYGINTIGSVAGAGIAGLIALPLLGLKGLIIAGAAIDVALGLWLLERSSRWTGAPLTKPAAAAVTAALLCTAVGIGVQFTPDTLASGVYSARVASETDRRRSLFYQDGRTATVSAHIGTSDGVIVLATNGKPDASVGPRWIMDRRDTLPELPIPQGRDFTTQILAPAVALAHRPDARTAANVGHGSGLTATSLLTSEALERLVTIEIEPLMVEGSVVFLPANEPAFTDPRMSYVFDDAKSYFSYQRERFDVIFAEPSNPWVSGIASLFTKEFYERISEFLGDGGVLGQWVQIYELDDDLVLSVVAALDEVFPSYRAYLVGDADLAIVASADPDLAWPDWSVVEGDAFRTMTVGAPPFRGQHMEPLFLFDEETLRPVLDRGVEPNSDYRPVLDLGAERARFEDSFAAGVYSLATSRVNLQRYVSNRPLDRRAFMLPPAYGLAPTVSNERGAWLREAMRVGGGVAPDEFPEWEEELVHLQTFFLLTGSSVQLGSWETWSSGFIRAENSLHWGLTEWVDSAFYENVYAFLDRGGAPVEARASVDLMHAFGVGDWSRAATAADRLVDPVGVGERWVPPDVLLDVAVLAYLEVGRPEAARTALRRLVPRTGRPSWHLRDRILSALVDAAMADSDGSAR